MEKFTNPLDAIKIASPCAADWNEMIGDERTRFCGACKLNVYNLSGMSRREAENLILQSEGNRLCVRFYRRADGTVLTKDCPVGWRAIKQNISKTATAFASLVFTALGAIGLTNYFSKSEQQTVGVMVSVENSEPLGNVMFTTGAIMGNVSVSNTPEYTLSNGGISNYQEVIGKVKINRKR